MPQGVYIKPWTLHFGICSPDKFLDCQRIIDKNRSVFFYQVAVLYKLSNGSYSRHFQILIHCILGECRPTDTRATYFFTLKMIFFKPYWIFFKSFIVLSVLLNIECIRLVILLGGWPRVLLFIVFDKLVVYGACTLWANYFYTNRLIFYKNLGISPLKLLSTSMLLDNLLFGCMVVVVQVL
jgi:hypothetical protein